MLSHQEIKEFACTLLLDYELHGILLVGSSARGYAIENSDIDLMAFYNTDKKLRSRPIHTKYKNIKFTLEHHDLQNFLQDTLDHRFNIVSLRQLYKVRDGIVLESDDSLTFLIKIARLAHLDVSVLLSVLKRIAAEWESALTSNQVYFRQFLIRWTELLATLDILTHTKSAAYSKPKWLYRALNLAELKNVIELLDDLYVSTPERVENVKKSIKHIIQSYNLQEFNKTFHQLVETAINDTNSILQASPQEAFPQVRFTANLYYKFIFGKDPINELFSNTKLENPLFEEIFELSCPQEFSFQVAISRFIKYAQALLNRNYDKIESEKKSLIGTQKFMGHILASYNVPDLLPLNHLTEREKSYSEVDLWLKNIVVEPVNNI
jgi:predicted nucleotidyltransferase